MAVAVGLPTRPTPAACRINTASPTSSDPDYCVSGGTNTGEPWKRFSVDNKVSSLAGMGVELSTWYSSQVILPCIDPAQWRLTSQPCLCPNHHSTWAYFVLSCTVGLHCLFLAHVRFVHKTTSQTSCFLLTDAGGRTCTCGVGEVYDAPTDAGDAGNWPFFPILSFNIGDTGNNWESVEYALGPLICKQGDEINCIFICC